ncbi:hypothetical protein [Candidatus Uabimicrobium sp. HlEnr_7]|uniref:hypothetical protein n=1 Tax=Candidatus Uabimicrobium helgolandensis TaxID=3095367 RepID=UPI003556ACC6
MLNFLRNRKYDLFEEETYHDFTITSFDSACSLRQRGVAICSHPSQPIFAVITNSNTETSKCLIYHSEQKILLHTIELEEEPCCLVFHENEKWLLIGLQTIIILWDIKSGMRLEDIHVEKGVEDIYSVQMDCIVFCDIAGLGSHTEGFIVKWDVLQKQIVQKYAIPKGSKFRSWTYLATKNFLAISRYRDVQGQFGCEIEIYDWNKNKLVQLFQHTFYCIKMIFTHNGKFLISSHKLDGLKIWEISTGKCTATFNEGRYSWILQLTKDDRYLFVHGLIHNYDLYVFDLANYELVYNFPNKCWLFCIHNFGKKIVCWYSDSVYIEEQNNLFQTTMKSCNIEKIENNTEYLGCSFYLNENLQHVAQGCIFENCSFRCNVVFTELTRSRFINCGFGRQFELDLSCKHLKFIPPELYIRFKFLTTLNLSNNKLKKISPQITNLTAVVSLDLSNNKLKHLPKEIVKLTSLSELNIKGNKLCSNEKEFLKSSLPNCRIYF